MNEKQLFLIGERIHELRLDKKLSQTQLGDMLAVSQDTISLWEKSKSLPPVNIIIRLSEIFEVSCDFLLGVRDY